MSTSDNQVPLLTHQLIYHTAKNNHQNIALLADNRTISYGELTAAARRLAMYLRWREVGPERLVAIALDRSIERIVAILAVMMAGGAFLPLDPAWPQQRRDMLLEDAQPAVLIGGADACLPGCPAICLARDAAAIAACPELEDPGDVGPADLAYVIYTSGSTGAPNGVEITHANLLNLIDWHRAAFAVTAKDRASHVAGLGFDAAVWEVWPYLCAGAAVVLPPEAVRTAPDPLRDWLVAQRISLAFVPTALAESLIVADWPSQCALRLLLTGGDRLHVRPRPGHPFAVVNNYGPTECSVVATSGPVHHDGHTGLPDIGQPITNTQIHLLSETGEPVAVGAIGEIHIGGAGVGRGYRNRRKLTAQRFIADRWAASPGAVLYRTGDLGRRLADARIAFEGRIDTQENIRGQRVEPDEVAAVLSQHEMVQSAVATGRTDAAGNRQLVAYVVPISGAAPTLKELRDFLSARLPEYMVPGAFVRLDQLPLTANGKVDRAGLPDPGGASAIAGADYRAPATPTERRLARIIGDLIGIERVGADDNFFELGGHSLLGTQLISRIREAFGVGLTLRHVFEAPTAAALAACVGQLLITRLEEMTEEDAERLLAI